MSTELTHLDYAIAHAELNGFADGFFARHEVQDLRDVREMQSDVMANNRTLREQVSPLQERVKELEGELSTGHQIHNVACDDLRRCKYKLTAKDTEIAALKAQIKAYEDFTSAARGSVVVVMTEFKNVDDYIKQVEQERDQLKAELEQLRADRDRLDWALAHTYELYHAAGSPPLRAATREQIDSARTQKGSP